MPSDGEALKQMAKALQYIHGLKFVHRDIKPSNIVISKSEPVKLMITNFSLCKATTDSGTYSLGSGNKGTEEWIAPEISNCFDDDDDDEPVKILSISSDTWALGCVFFYFLTRGIHPFGKNLKKIRYNILVKERASIEFEKTLQSSNEKMVKVCKLIGDMIHVEPEKRISLEHVVKDLEIIYPSDTNSNQRSSFNKVWLMIPNQYESSTNIKSQYNLDSK
jgi:serine/threonine protein kinase